jgi:hypothetical protein
VRGVPAIAAVAAPAISPAANISTSLAGAAAAAVAAAAASPATTAAAWALTPGVLFQGFVSDCSSSVGNMKGGDTHAFPDFCASRLCRSR